MIIYKLYENILNEQTIKIPKKVLSSMMRDIIADIKNYIYTAFLHIDDPRFEFDKEKFLKYFPGSKEITAPILREYYIAKSDFDPKYQKRIRNLILELTYFAEGIKLIGNSVGFTQASFLKIQPGLKNNRVTINIHDYISFFNSRPSPYGEKFHKVFVIAFNKSEDLITRILKGRADKEIKSSFNAMMNLILANLRHELTHFIESMLNSKMYDDEKVAKSQSLVKSFDDYASDEIEYKAHIVNSLFEFTEFTKNARRKISKEEFKKITFGKFNQFGDYESWIQALYRKDKNKWKKAVKDMWNVLQKNKLIK